MRTLPFRSSTPLLIDVVRDRRGGWRASCECGSSPEAFASEEGAWSWVVEHACPATAPEAPLPRHIPAQRTPGA